MNKYEIIVYWSRKIMLSLQRYLSCQVVLLMEKFRLTLADTLSLEN